MASRRTTKSEPKGNWPTTIMNLHRAIQTRQGEPEPSDAGIQGTGASGMYSNNHASNMSIAMREAYQEAAHRHGSVTEGFMAMCVSAAFPSVALVMGRWVCAETFTAPVHEPLRATWIAPGTCGGEAEPVSWGGPHAGMRTDRR